MGARRSARLVALSKALAAGFTGGSALDEPGLAWGRWGRPRPSPRAPLARRHEPDARTLVEAHGIVAEFDSAESLLRAVRSVRAAGLRVVDAFSPHPVPGLSDALGLPRSRLATFVLLGGGLGIALGFGLQYWASVIHYPHVVGGRPLLSWPAFVPVTFITAVLCAAAAALLGFLARSRLPELHHPVFDTPGFERASSDAYFLCIEGRDPRFTRLRIAALLDELGAVRVSYLARGAEQAG